MKKRTKKKVWKFTKKVAWLAWQALKYSAKGIAWAARGAWRLARRGSQKVAAAPAAKAARRTITSKNRTPPSFSSVNVTKDVQGSFADFESPLLKKSLIALIFGKRGSGKSTLGFRLMENIHAKTKRPCFVLGVKQSLLPSWIEEVQSLDEVRKKGVVLVDEGALSFSARESMSKKNTALGKLLAIARHKDLTLLLVTQNTGMIDKNVLSLTDVIIAKEGSLLQKQMEREAVKDFVNTADAAIKSLPKNDRVKHAYVFSDDFEGLLNIPLPSFWSESVSKSRG